MKVFSAMRGSVKKLLAACLMISVALVFAACSGAPEQRAPESVPTAETGQITAEAAAPAGETEKPSQETENPAEQTPARTNLVVYFSATGTTRGVAERIAALTGADLAEIVPAQPYTSEDLNYNDRTTRASAEQDDSAARPEIAEDISLRGYTTVFLGYPIWWGQAPRIMSTFVESHDFSGMTMIPFCTSGSSDIGQSDDTLAAQSGSGNWLQGRRFAGSVSEGQLREWIDETGITTAEKTLRLFIGDTEVPAEWENNASVGALIGLVESGPLTVSMSMYGGFEQVGPLGTSLPRDDAQTSADYGDIVLYSGDQIVIFYGSNSWSYTRLGHIGLSKQEMTDLLSAGNVNITLKYD
ncbi:MAG: hypothetical protein ILP09_02570 [Oscillospiraceae bacterium]|nr:hypothetical protein [Oscillospiraceae bacterium]